MTRALDTRTFYVIPRLNPDGAELALAERPRYVRSSVRKYPLPEREDGLHAEDVDGDGRVLTMRLRDPNGNWKPHPDAPALLVRREPDEEGGDYYRVLPEGTIQNFDGVAIKLPGPAESLDLNRNFPGEWGPEADQRGSGPYPTSEPEIRAIVEAVVERPNITGAIAYHTFSGVHLRPYASYADDHLPTGDLRAYRQIGEVATQLTGYPAISVFHDFAYDPKQSIKGSGSDFMYDQRGVFAWTTEFWSPQRQAGIADYKYIDWIRDHPPEDDLKLYRWSEEKLGGRGYVAWKPFDHPQLGEVEIGGWDSFYAWANVPFEQLEEEIAPHTEFAIFHCLISPRLATRSLDVERAGGRPLPRAARAREHRLAADERLRAGAPAQGGAGPRGRGRAAGGRTARGGRAGDEGGAARRSRPQALDALVADERRDDRPREARVGGGVAERRRARDRGAAPAGRDGAGERRRGCALEAAAT